MISNADLKTIALLETLQDVSKNVPGMKGLFDHVVRSQPINRRKLMHRYLKIKEAQRLEFIKQAEADGWAPPQ